MMDPESSWVGKWQRIGKSGVGRDSCGSLDLFFLKLPLWVYPLHLYVNFPSWDDS